MVHFGSGAASFSQAIPDVELMLDRERQGREASTPGAVVDSQSVKSPQAGTRGCDGGKRIVGRKRHIAVDTDGRLLTVKLTTADISDRAGAQAIRKRWASVKHLFAGSADDRLTLMDKAAYLDFVTEIVRRSKERQGSEVLPRRWVVERTFGRGIGCRRVRDDERRIDVSTARIYVVMGGVLLHRNAHF